MANIILPQVNILEEINETAKILVEQNGEINRFHISDLNIDNIEVDSSLKIEGMAADAKAVGDAINDLSIDIAGAGSINIDLNGSNLGNANTINADTLGGALPSDYATKTYTNTQVKTYTNTQVKKATPKNLLDNSDFRNPINQRGQTSYTGISNGNAYTIDRWVLSWQGNTTVTVGDGYIQKNEGKYLQFIENIDLNKIYTGALCLADGTLYVYSGTFGSGFGAWDSSIYMTEDGGYCWFRIEKNMTQPMIWAALYEGEYTVDTLPEYRPKGYAAELMECQRYYVRYANTGTIGIQWGLGGSNGSEAFVAHRLPIPMRITPSITYDKVNLYAFSVGSAVAVSRLSIESSASTNNVVVIKANFSTSGAIAAQNIAAIRILTDGYIAFSADL